MAWFFFCQQHSAIANAFCKNEMTDKITAFMFHFIHNDKSLFSRATLLFPVMPEICLLLLREAAGLFGGILIRSCLQVTTKPINRLSVKSVYAWRQKRRPMRDVATSVASHFLSASSRRINLFQHQLHHFVSASVCSFLQLNSQPCFFLCVFLLLLLMLLKSILNSFL